MSYNKKAGGVAMQYFQYGISRIQVVVKLYHSASVKDFRFFSLYNITDKSSIQYYGRS